MSTLYGTIPNVQNRIDRLAELIEASSNRDKVGGFSTALANFRALRTDEGLDVGQVIAALDALRDSVTLLNEAHELGRVAKKNKK